VRRHAADAFGSAFGSILDASKDQALHDLIRLTHDNASDVRSGAASALGSAFGSIPAASKDQAWQDLIHLTQDDDRNVRSGAAYAFGRAFGSIPAASKVQALHDLHRLTQDDDSDVRSSAASTLGSAFGSIPAASKDQAWQDLHRLTQDDNSDVRRKAADARHDLHRLMQDDDSYVRREAADALGSAFRLIPDALKDQAWHDLIRLTQDYDREVRVSANYSLGKVSLLKATDAANKNEFKNELKNALDFFEKSNAEATFINPARFCHPFYKSIFSITFEEQSAEAEVQEYIKEAKNAIEGSESKKILLEAVENLENALYEVYKSREKGLDAWKSDLKAYRRYCDRACNLLDKTEKDAPGATKIIRKGLPIIDQQIKEIIEVHHISKSIKTKYPIRLEKGYNEFQFILSAICDKMPEEEKKELDRQLEKANNKIFIEDKFVAINIILSKISSQIGRLKEMPKYQFENTKQVNIFEKSSTETSNNIEKLEKKLDEMMFSIKPGISEELVISVGAEVAGTGAQHVITIPIQKISYSDLEKDLKSIKGNTVSKLTSLPKKLVGKIKNYLIQNKKDDLLKELE